MSRPKTLIPLVVVPKGMKKPRYLREEVFASFQQVQSFFRFQTGKTFTLRKPVVKTLPWTWADVKANHLNLKDAGQNIWRETMQYAFANRWLPLSQAYGYYLVYLRPPEIVLTGNGYINGFGGMVGMENKGLIRPPNPDPADWSRPGMACIADEKAWLIAGVDKAKLKTAGWAMPWFADDRWQSLCSLAHETVHIYSELPHGDYTGDNITYEWWAGLKTPGTGILHPDEIAAILATGAFG